MGKRAALLRRASSAGAAYVASKLGRGIAVVTSPAFIAALVSLALSGITLYVTVLEAPQLTVYAGCNWEYGRGPGSFDEYFVVPVTVVNSGARNGTVLGVELVVDKGGVESAFTGNFILGGPNDQTRRLFAPIAIAGRASASSAVVFTRPVRTSPPLIDLATFAAPERFRATLKLRTAVPVSYTFVDRLFARPSADARFEPLLRPGDLAPLRDDKPATFDACPSARPQSASPESR